jgi:hypothetical protein
MIVGEEVKVEGFYVRRSYTTRWIVLETLSGSPLSFVDRTLVGSRDAQGNYRRGADARILETRMYTAFTTGHYSRENQFPRLKDAMAVAVELARARVAASRLGAYTAE